MREIRTPLLPVGSRAVAQALVLLGKYWLVFDCFLACLFLPPSGLMGTDEDIHERIVHSDDENLTGFLQLGVVDVAWDVGARARGA